MKKSKLSKAVDYYNSSPALLPKAARVTIQESFRLLKSVGVLLVWSILAAVGYLSFNTDQIPVTFERELAKIVECGQETIEGKQRYTVTIDQDEIQTKFVELSKDLWVDATNVSNVPNSAMVEKFNQVKNAEKASKELGLASPDMDMSVKTYSIIPSLK